jgi:hypothetical protein
MKGNRNPARKRYTSCQFQRFSIARDHSDFARFLGEEKQEREKEIFKEEKQKEIKRPFSR